MGRVILYLIMLVQFLGGLIAFYRVDPKILVSSISLESGLFLGLFLLIHLLGLVGAVLVLLGRRFGLTLSLAHQVLMLVGVKIGTTFVFITHDVVSFFVFFVSSFGEVHGTYRWSVGMDTIFAQLAANTRGTYIGLNLLALACAGYLWWALRLTATADEEADIAEAPRRPRQQRPPGQPRPAQMEGRPQRRAV
jgi:hypothetical protein